MILELHMYLKLYLTQYTQFNSECIIHLDVKDRTVKFLRESIKENPYKLRRGKNYLK